MPWVYAAIMKRTALPSLALAVFSALAPSVAGAARTSTFMGDPAGCRILLGARDEVSAAINLRLKAASAYPDSFERVRQQILAQLESEIQDLQANVDRLTAEAEDFGRGEDDLLQYLRAAQRTHLSAADDVDRAVDGIRWFDRMLSAVSAASRGRREAFQRAQESSRLALEEVVSIESAHFATGVEKQRRLDEIAAIRADMAALEARKAAVNSEARRLAQAMYDSAVTQSVAAEEQARTRFREGVGQWLRRNDPESAAISSSIAQLSALRNDVRMGAGALLVLGQRMWDLNNAVVDALAVPTEASLAALRASLDSTSATLTGAVTATTVLRDSAAAVPSLAAKHAPAQVMIQLAGTSISAMATLQEEITAMREALDVPLAVSPDRSLTIMNGLRRMSRAVLKAYGQIPEPTEELQAFAAVISAEIETLSQRQQALLDETIGGLPFEQRL